MTTYDNAAPLPDWAPDCRCGVCHTCLPKPTDTNLIPPNIELGGRGD